MWESFAASEPLCAMTIVRVPRRCSHRTWSGSSRDKTLHGVDEVANFYLGKPSGGPENLDVEFDPGELEAGGGGRVSAVNHQIFRWKESGELAYERRVRIDYTIRDGRIVKYEATFLDE